MSQWYDSEWEHEGSTYRSAEEWMMVQKARLFGDEVCWGFVFGKKARGPPSLLLLPIDGRLLTKRYRMLR